MMGKRYVVIMLFAAMLVAMPFASFNAFAADVVIPGICGVTVPGTIDIGTLTVGIEGTETAAITITTDGNTPGTFEVNPTDWIGNGNEATGNLELASVLDAQTVTINSILYTAEDDGVTTGEAIFAVDGTDAQAATSLATQINADTRAVDVGATAIGNVVLLRSDAIGVAANNIPLLASAGTITLSGATMDNGDAQGATIMASTVTRISFTTTTGVDPTPSNYAAKSDNAFPAAGVTDPIIAETDPTNDIKMRFHLTGVGGTILDTQYDGGITQTITFSTTCN